MNTETKQPPSANADFSLYDPHTGLFAGRSFTGPRAAIAAHTPDGLAAIEGHHDHLSRRVDLTGEKPAVVDYQPPQPSPDHEWHTASRRWQLSPSAQERQAKRRAARAQIAALEASQARAVREHLLGNPEGTTRLKAIEEQVAALRGTL